MVRRILVGALALVGLGLGVLVAGSLLSLDWSRTHSARTAALPQLDASTSQGLVRIEANGLVFRARVAGFDSAGPGLVLLHGYPESSAMWEPLIAEAAGRGYRVIAFDQRGFGRSRCAPEARHPRHFAADLAAVLDAARVRRVAIVCQSLGGWCGLPFALAHPEYWRER